MGASNTSIFETLYIFSEFYDNHTNILNLAQHYFLAKYYHLFVVHCNGNIACNIGPFLTAAFLCLVGLWYIYILRGLQNLFGSKSLNN